MSGGADVAGGKLVAEVAAMLRWALVAALILGKAAFGAQGLVFPSMEGQEPPEPRALAEQLVSVLLRGALPRGAP